MTRALASPLTDSDIVSILGARLRTIFGRFDPWDGSEALTRLLRDPEVKRNGIHAMRISSLLDRARDEMNCLRCLDGLGDI